MAASACVSNEPVVRPLSPSARFYSSYKTQSSTTSSSSSAGYHHLLIPQNLLPALPSPPYHSDPVPLATTSQRFTSSPSTTNRTCMCSPSTHPGAFRCRLHKTSTGQNKRSNNNDSRAKLEPNRFDNSSTGQNKRSNQTNSRTKIESNGFDKSSIGQNKRSNNSTDSRTETESNGFDKNSTGQNKGNNSSHSRTKTVSNGLDMRRFAMTNLMVKNGKMGKRALVALIRPSSHKQRQCNNFRHRASRLSVMSKAED